MDEKKKKPYVKPMIVMENFETGELTGSPEMIAQIIAENQKNENNRGDCPFEDMPCFMRR